MSWLNWDYVIGLVYLLENWGFVVSKPKYVRKPMQTTEFLGFSVGVVKQELSLLSGKVKQVRDAASARKQRVLNKKIVSAPGKAPGSYQRNFPGTTLPLQASAGIIKSAGGASVFQTQPHSPRTVVVMLEWRHHSDGRAPTRCAPHNSGQRVQSDEGSLRLEAEPLNISTDLEKWGFRLTPWLERFCSWGPDPNWQRQKPWMPSIRTEVSCRGGVMHPSSPSPPEPGGEIEQS